MKNYNKYLIILVQVYNNYVKPIFKQTPIMFRTLKAHKIEGQQTNKKHQGSENIIPKLLLTSPWVLLFSPDQFYNKFIYLWGWGLVLLLLFAVLKEQLIEGIENEKNVIFKYIKFFV